jgi:hypothetical protein
MSKRFKLVFLGEDEEYITDVGCTVDMRRISVHNEATSSYPSSLTRLVRSGGFTGRLRVASNSIYLDLDSIVRGLYFPCIARYDRKIL